MKILETSDTAWIEELAKLTTEMLSLLEHMDREQGIDEYRRNGGRSRPGMQPGMHYASLADPREQNSFEVFQQAYYGGYQVYPIGHYNSYVREFQHRADKALREKKEKMG